MYLIKDAYNGLSKDYCVPIYTVRHMLHTQSTVHTLSYSIVNLYFVHRVLGSSVTATDITTIVGKVPTTRLPAQRDGEIGIAASVSYKELNNLDVTVTGYRYLHRDVACGSNTINFLNISEILM